MANRTALVAVMLLLALSGCANREEEDAFAGIITNDSTTQEPDLRGLPSIHDLPPVDPQATGRLQATALVGPRNPQRAWAVSLPFSSANIHQIGVDNTVYAGGMDGEAAVRDGKLLWAFNIYHPGAVTMANDGRIWIEGYEQSGYFCLNRSGQGGLLPKSVKRPLDARKPPSSGCNNRDFVSDGRAVANLGYECTESVMGPDGSAYVATNAPDIQALTPDFVPSWKLTTPCFATSMLAGPGNRVLFTCKDQSIHYVEKGALKWTLGGDGKMERWGADVLGIIDRNGNIIFIDTEQRGAITHIHALSSTGNPVWTRTSPNLSVSSLQLDGKSRLYITASRGSHRWLICLSD